MVKLEFNKLLGLSNVTCVGPQNFVVFDSWGSLPDMVFVIEEYVLILESSSS
jgi:hypothetical protein